jgi:hypothetical protein
MWIIQCDPNGEVAKWEDPDYYIDDLGEEIPTVNLTEDGLGGFLASSDSLEAAQEVAKVVVAEVRDDKFAIWDCKINVKGCKMVAKQVEPGDFTPAMAIEEGENGLIWVSGTCKWEVEFMALELLAEAEK